MPEDTPDGTPDVTPDKEHNMPNFNSNSILIAIALILAIFIMGVWIVRAF